MSLQFRESKRRRRQRRRIIITIRVILVVLVLGLIVFGSINVYSYFNNKNTEINQEANNIDELPIESDIDKNTGHDTNSNGSSSEGILDNNNGKDHIQGNGENNKPENNKPENNKPENNKPENNKPENNKPENNKPENAKPESNKPVNNETDKDKTSNSGSKDNNKGDIKKDVSYFDDAVFIGDSRTEGLKLYSGLKNATFYAEKGLDVATIFENKISISGSKMTIIDALHNNTFGKVYINLGVNELGWPYDSEFIKNYEKVIDSLKETQPNAEIYMQSIIHVNREKDKSLPKYFNNKIVDRRNKLLKKLASEKEINYIDANEVLTDNKGYLFEEATVDGIHLNKAYCIIWKEYLIEHIVK